MGWGIFRRRFYFIITRPWAFVSDVFCSLDHLPCRFTA
jgi:hypothetical protein